MRFLSKPSADVVLGMEQKDPLLVRWQDPELLKRLSSFTGGRFEPSARQVFDAGGRAIPTTLSLWPGLLAAAVALNIGELISRKWKGLVDFFRRR